MVSPSIKASVAVLCRNKVEEYNVIARDFNLKYNCCRILIDEVREEVREGIKNYTYIARSEPKLENIVNIEQLNLSTVDNGLNVPSCLSVNPNSVQKIDLQVKNLLRNVKNVYVDTVVDVMNSIVSKKNNINDKSLLAERLITDVVNKVETAYQVVLEPNTSELFKSLDKLNEYFIGVNIPNSIKKLQSLTECLKTNCKENIKDMVNLHKVLDDPDTCLPIDRYTGEFKPYKLFDRRTLDADFSEKLSLLNNDYLSFIASREESSVKIKQEIQKRIGDLQ